MNVETVIVKKVVRPGLLIIMHLKVNLTLAVNPYESLKIKLTLQELTIASWRRDP